MLYILCLLTIIFFAISELYGQYNNDGICLRVFNRNKNIIFFILIVALTLITSIRYGSGTDYFSYRWYYNDIPKNLISAITSDSHLDIGFRIIISILKNFGINFEGFIFIISIVIMTCYIQVINTNSKIKMISVFIFFSMYYEAYVTNLLRQGLSMSIFFVAYYNLLKKNKVKEYCLTIIIAAIFHKSILIALVCPIIHRYYKKLFYNKKFNISILTIALLICIFNGDKLINWVSSLFGIIIPYEGEGVSLLALGLRLLMLFIVCILYKFSDKEKVDDFERFQIYTYFICIVIYLCIANNPLYSRFTDILSMIEIIMIPNLIYSITTYKKSIALLAIIISIMSITYIKDITISTYFGEYYEKGAVKYPYITIFNKSKILKYRYIREPLKPNAF